ncbi:hypothetical protein TNCV_3449231 [Trichonephila clavipes]|nr:hypothetical protein TNCV_3449231 [Trichonephila clavipes]
METNILRLVEGERAADRCARSDSRANQDGRQTCADNVAPMEVISATLKDSFSTKSVNFCYVRWVKDSSTFSPDEYSTRITLSGEFQLITEKSTPPFLWCP